LVTCLGLGSWSLPTKPDRHIHSTARSSAGQPRSGDAQLDKAGTTRLGLHLAKPPEEPFDRHADPAGAARINGDVPQLEPRTIDNDLGEDVDEALCGLVRPLEQFA
jgi:hypothetical protein